MGDVVKEGQIMWNERNKLRQDKVVGEEIKKSEWTSSKTSLEKRQ